MSAKNRLAIIKELGFPITEKMVGREYRKELNDIILAQTSEAEADKLHFLVTCSDEQLEQGLEAQGIADWLGDTTADPRTPEQIALDEWQADSASTRESDRPQ